ncbi:MAG TPA: MarR family winged helix-turn-helix transcriptional regulator [Vicinamibacterales bacterium]|jgi:DNA-binding MarR family transcriptional regulator|nr:MarR family winged helix-turn-helix transcriptional regulator [Vicinamibacterales bacterium]
MKTPRSRATIDDVSRECVAVRLRMLNRIITNVYDEALRPLGVRISQMNILVAAARLGLARPAVVCDLLQLDASTLSRNVERMRGRRWLETVPGEDAREQPFRLTVEGRRLLERCIPAWNEAQRQALECLGADGVAAVEKALRRSGGRAAAHG